MKRLVSILAFMVLAVACVYDDYTACSSLMLHFNYKGDSNYEIFDDKISDVSLYLFDSNQRLVQIKKIPRAELFQVDETMIGDLPFGDYFVVCVGNAYANTEVQIKLGQNIREMHIANPNVFSKKDVQTNDSLYYGYKKININANGIKVNDTINFASAHIKIYVEVAGYLELFQHNVSDLRLSIDNIPASINYLSADEGKYYSYHPKFKFSDKNNLYYTQFNVLRFQEKSDIMLRLYNLKNELVYEIKLEDFFKKYPYDFKKNELTIGIRIDFTPSSISIDVPEWITRGIDPIY